MPDLEQRLIIKAISEGFSQISKDINSVGGAVDETTKAAKQGATGWTELASKLSVARQAFDTVAGVAKVAYGAINEGAQLQQAQGQFENLAASIGTTAESIDTKLKAATSGMMSQAERMAGASQIISLGLAQNEEDVVRLAKATGTLGLDMQQVILTFANNSKARLDALGLSVEGVTQKAAELEAQGFKGDAFDEAVLIGLEEKMTLLGDASETTAGSLKIIESAIKDLTDTGKIWMAQKWEGPIVGLANTINDTSSAWDKLVVSGAEFNKMMFGVQGVWGAAADKARANAKANAETEESFRAVAEAATLTKDEYNDLIPAIEEASQADYKFADSVTYGTAELVARTEEAVRGAGGMDAYRRAEEHSLTTEEAMAVAVSNTNAALANTPAAAEAAASLLSSVSAGADGATRGVGGLNSALDVAMGRSTELITPLEEIFGALQEIENRQAASDLISTMAENQQFAADAAVVLEEKLTGVYTGLQDTGGQADSSAGQIGGYKAALDSIPSEVVTNIVTNHIENYSSANVPGRGGETRAAGGHRYASGADFVVPPGYPNDSFGPLWVQSGERVQVTPPGQTNNSNSLTVTQNFYGTPQNAMAQARDGLLEAARAIGLTGYA